MKARYIDAAAGVGVHGDLAGGWTFLAAETPGDDAAIRRVADARRVSIHLHAGARRVGASGRADLLVSDAGTVTRYVYGIEYEPAMMRESIFKAGIERAASTAVGFMYRCYHYDPDANSHAHAGVVALRSSAPAVHRPAARGARTDAPDP